MVSRAAFVSLALCDPRAHPLLHLRQRLRVQVRWTFYTGNSFQIKNDGFASFNTPPSELFNVNVVGKYTKGSAYSFTVLAQQAGVNFEANIICWGLRPPQDYRVYDHGLHMGIAGYGDCHLINDNGAVQMKSHITSGESLLLLPLVVDARETSVDVVGVLIQNFLDRCCYLSAH